MPFQRMTALFLLVFLAVGSTVSFAATSAGIDLGAWQLDSSSSIASTAQPQSGTLLISDQPVTDPHAAVPATAAESAPPPGRLRKLLADFAVTLRDIRYRRGGREPSTGFDCSGFVHYVFHHSLGQDLPSDSASQFLAGTKVDRSDMKIGDLVFFHTRGKRVSHVGIYLGDGQFIHSPSSGKRVSINNLDESYWSHRFIGAKRPHGLS